jgi:hypothetical protein
VIRGMKSKCRWKWELVLSLGLCFVWLCLAELRGVNAQSSAAATQSDGKSRLVTTAEGRAIAAAALEREQLPSGAQDCSHAVHQFYFDAGFEYEYASSFEIYEGNENFARVKTPQAGDLIAWPGHIGIVTDPVQHNFYSLVSSGLETQGYDGPYWSSRGRPRFFRYKILDSGGVRVANAAPPQRRSDVRKQSRTITIAGESAPAASAGSNRPPTAASERKPVISHPRNSEAPEDSNERAEDLSSILIGTANKKPTRDEVAKGISELSSAAGNILRSDDPLKISPAVVIFERFTVEKVEVKRGHGWAHLKVASRASLAGSGTELKRHNEKVRWKLRRTKSGWEAIAPTDRTYVPQDVAVRNLAAQLARLTEQNDSSSDQEAILLRESQLANLLSVLLQNK